MAEINALGATLLHSLWQATLLAGVLWSVARYGRQGAAGRYRLAYGTLIGQLLLSVATFFHYYSPAPRFEGTVKRVIVELVYTPSATPTTTALAEPAFWMFALVGCWLLSILVGSAKLLYSFGRVRGMQRQFQEAVPLALNRTVHRLAERIGYRGALRISVGSGITAPMLIGHLRPVLFFPLAIVNQLSTEEAETVILHELAHLRRYDHYFNLLQCLIDVLYYYHPAVHWIGARIREEREYCCDDLVLDYGPGRLPYARALLHYGERASAPLATTLSLTDGGGLLTRVTRFLHNQPTTYTMKRKFLFLPLLAAFILISTAAYVPFAEIPKSASLALDDLAPTPTRYGTPLHSAPPTDTLPPGTHEVTRISNGKVTKLKVEDRQIKALEIDGREVPPSEFKDNEKLAEELLDVKPPQESRNSDAWHFDFPPDSLHRIAARALESVDMQRIPIDLEGVLEGLELQKIELEQLDLDNRFDYDYDSLSRMYLRVTERVNLDSLVETATKLGRYSMDLDSLQLSWGLDTSHFDFRTFHGQDGFQYRLGDDLDYIEHEEEVLRRRLRALESRKEAIKERDKATKERQKSLGTNR